MKLLTKAPRREDLLDIQQLLRSRGIPTYLQNKYTAKVPRVRLHPGLFVILDDQYPDAIALLHDENHRVNSPLDEQEIIELERLARQNASTLWRRLSLYATLLICGIVFALYWLSGL